MNKKCSFRCILGLLLLIGPVAQAQVGTIKGNVHNLETGEPLFLCNIQIINTSRGSVTDENGYFHFSQLSPGNYTLIFSSMGFARDTVTRQLRSGEIVNLKINLKPTAKDIDEVVVSARKNQKQTQIQASVTQVTTRELKKIPQIGAEPDLAQFLQTIPGFVHSGDQGGQLYIRGGSEVQNIFLLDDIPVFNPFHSLGLFSVIDSDILQSVSVYSGGFPADFGGRISSVMDTKTRDGNLNKVAGKLSMSTLGMNASIEGPISKNPAFRNSSFILSGKTSLISSLAPILYPYTGETGIPYGFTDLFGKITKAGASGSKISLTGFRFSDQVRIDSMIRYNWVNRGLGCNVTLVPGNTNGLIRAGLNWSNYAMHLTETDLPERFSEIESIKLLLEFVNYFGPDELKFGLETLAMASRLDYLNRFGFAMEEDINTTDLALYVNYRMKAGRLILESGIRGSWYATQGHFIPEPRLGMKFNLADNYRIKAACGYYSQNLVSARPDQDVVNYFTGYVLEPLNVASNFGLYQVKHTLQTAWHWVAGVEAEPWKPVQVNLEVYAKYFPQTITLNRNKRFPDDSRHADVPQAFTSFFLSERGWAYGTDLRVQYSAERLFAQLSYSLAWVRKFDGFQYYYPHYDRRHNLNLVGSYYFGNPASPWEINARFNLGTGFPFTPVSGYYNKLDLSEYTSESILGGNDFIGVLFADVNSSRLPVYHRLDLTLKRTLPLGRSAKLELSFSLYNAYDYKNLFYFDAATYQVRYQLPVLPVIGLKYILI